MGTRWGVTNQQAIHHVDALTWICGEVESVCALSATIENKLQAEDTLVAAIEMKNGGLATLELTTAASQKILKLQLPLLALRELYRLAA